MASDTPQVRQLVIALLVIAVFLPRLTSLGTMLTVDEGLWRGRGEQFIKSFASGHFNKTLVAGQPGVTTAWLAGLSLPWRSLASAQAAIAVTCGALILLITYSLSRLWGFWWGMASGFLLALDPFLLAHSRLVHTDALFALFYLASLLWLLLALEPAWQAGLPSRRHIVISGILGGLALLTKIFTTILIPTVTCIFLLAAWRSRKHLGETFRSGIIWLVAVVLTTLALWPALWTAPDQVAQYLTGRATLHVAEGTHVGETTATWWYYGRESIFRLSAITTLLLIPAAIAAFKSRDRMWRTALILLISGIAFAIVLSFSSEKSDRYILISLLTLDLFAVMGLRKINEWVSYLQSERSRPNSGDLARGAGLPSYSPAQAGRTTQENRSQDLGRLEASDGARKTTGWVAPTIAITLLAIGAARIHPYYLAHHNALYPVEERHKLGWGEGLEQAAQWIKKQGYTGKIASYYAGVMKYWYPGPVDPLNHIDGTSARYIVLYRSMFERGPGHVDTEIVAEYLDNASRQPAHIISINNLPYVWIFERE